MSGAMALEQGSLLQRSGLEQLWAIVPDMTSESWRPMDSEFKLIRKRLFTTAMPIGHAVQEKIRSTYRQAK
jgi:hypothetical protein